MDNKWKIWINYFDDNHNYIGLGVHVKSYKHKSSAKRTAKKLYSNPVKFQYGIGKTNPFAL